jgi:hypothetical protein
MTRKLKVDLAKLTLFLRELEARGLVDARKGIKDFTEAEFKQLLRLYRNTRGGRVWR